jgi:hypothetical protein
VSDDLTISGGGSFAVASDALLGDAQALESVRDDTRDTAALIASIDARLCGAALRRADAPLSALEAEANIDRALAALTAAQSRAAVTAASLRIAAEGYGRADAAATRVAQNLAAHLGYGAGALLPLVLGAVMPALPAVLAGAALSFVVGRAALRAAPEALELDPRALTNPLAVSLVRATVMSVDDFVGGAIGIPPAVMRAIGDEGAGILGVATSAAGLAAVGSTVGMLRDGPVTATVAARGEAAAAPRGLAERLRRVPGPSGAVGGGGAHISIERYTAPNEADRFEVYIAGTADFSPISSGEAFDLTSSVTGTAGLPAGSVRAVEMAMADAGVTANTPVQFTGYSQGGLVAAALAASGDYDTRGVFTAGAPTPGVELPTGIPVVQLEHTDDIVPALGGIRSETTALLVEREAFAGREVPGDRALPAHAREEYLRTARLADLAESERLAEAIGRLDGFAAGATSAGSVAYRAERVPR